MTQLFLFRAEVMSGGLFGLDLDGNSLDDPETGFLQRLQFIGVV